jgi:hypothetical protein
MSDVGRTPTGDHVLQFPGNATDSYEVIPIVRPGTPQLPWQLLYEPPTLRTFPDPVLEEVPEDDDEEFEAALAAAWMPTSDAQLGRVPLPNAEAADALERVPYDARDCNWRTILNAENLPKLVFSNFLMPNADVPGTSAEQTEDAVRDEEGEWKKERLSKVHRLLIHEFGTGMMMPLYPRTD